MDRNSVIGLVLIGLILATYTFLKQPSQEEIDAAKRKKEQAAAVKKKEEVKSSDTISMNGLVPKLDEKGNQVVDTNGALVYTDTLNKKEVAVPQTKVETPSETSNAAQPEAGETSVVKETAEVKKEIKGELIRLENKKLIIDFSTKGGRIAAVRLKEFESYDDFAKNDNKTDPLLLFQDGDAYNGLRFPLKKDTVNTNDMLFTVKSQSKEGITFVTEIEDGTVEFSYKLNSDAYDLKYDITVRDLNGKVAPQNVMLDWRVAYRKSERLLSEQRRVSTICYNYKEEGFSYLSEMADDDLSEFEDEIDWVSFKQSYFSSFLNPENGFAKTGSKMRVVNYNEGHPREQTHIKQYGALMNLNLKSTENGTVSMNWYFGPNDYKVLTSYNDDYDAILNYGWGLFRWINLYAIQPLFNLLKSTGLGVGLVILLLTIILKFALMPIQWKMFTSSAKMRILKPEIDELNQKYPEKEDAMKKQMEMMTLYRESGASPLSGCVPMLIQMPILLAVFRFFPSTFDLRQKGFLWAEDLSSYDSVYDFTFNIPLYGDHISLFTLLMAATTLVYTYINSNQMQTPQQPGMPNMKVIMYFFPVMMIFFFNNYSSGLSYYYFISTLMTILIMILIKQFFVDEEKLKLKMANRKAAASSGGTAVKKKSKFQERLEQMQKQQMEQMKNKKKK